MDYIFFFYGLAFILLGAVGLVMHKNTRQRLPWSLLVWFAFLHGTNEWVHLVRLSFIDGPAIQVIHLVLLTVSFMCLMEFGRSGWQNIRGCGPGSWIFLPLFGLAALGFCAGAHGLQATVRYTFGLIGGLWAASALWEASKIEEVGRRALQAAACVMTVYAITAGLVVSKVPLFPADIFNDGVFLRVLHVPIQVVRGLLACGLASAAWFYFNDCERWLILEEDRQMARRNTYGLVVALFLFLWGGLYFTHWVGINADRTQRKELITLARRVATTVDADYIDKLGGTPADLSSPYYQQLKDHLRTMRGSLKDVRFIYLMRKVQNRVIFLVDSEPESSADYSAPGSVYSDVTDKFAEIFVHGWPLVEGPVPDQWGVWVTGAVPIRNTHTGELTAVLGIDRDAKDFYRALAVERLKAIVFVMLFCFAIVMSFIYQRHSYLVKNSLNKADWFMVWSPLAVIFLIGGTLTVMVFLQERSRMFNDCYEQFQLDADERIGAVKQELNNAADDLTLLTYLNSTESLNNHSNFVRFITCLEQIRHFMHLVQWVPRVAGSERAEYEARLRAEGVNGFQFLQKDSEGALVRADDRQEYYPIVHSYPMGEERLGLNLALDADLGPLLSKARDTGLPVATGRRGAFGKASVGIIAPVYRAGQTPANTADRRRLLEGFVMMYLTVRNIAETAIASLAPEGLPFLVEDLSASDGRGALYYHETRMDHKEPRSVLEKRAKIQNTFHFAGREWRITVFLGHNFLERNFFAGYLWILPVGLTLTTVMGLFITTLLNSRRKAETMVRLRTDQLVHEKERLSITLRSIGDGVIVFDASRRVVLMNPSAELMTGYSEGQAKGKVEEEIFKIIDTQTRKKASSITQQVFDSGEAFELTYNTVLIAADGKELEVANSCAPIIRKGIIIGAVLVFRDVTLRRKAQAALRESEQMLNTIIRHLPVGLFIIDCETRRIVNVNEETCVLIGLPKEEIIGKVCHEFICENKVGACPLIDQQQSIDHCQCNILRQGKIEIPVLKTVVPIQIKGRPHLLECAVDISEQIKNEEELKKAKETAETANRTRTEFLANMSHEIRTPMNAVLGFVDLLKRTNLDAQQRGYLETVSSSGEQLLTIINDILDISKIEAGQLLIERVNFNLSFLVEDVLKAVRTRAEGKSIKVFCEIASNVPVNLEGDPSKIYQILSNLMGNGVKFTHEGIVGLEVTLQEEMGGDKVVLQFCISDTGVGIPADQKDKIFEKFTQLDMSVTRPYGGTGLGLSISKSMIEAMGGAIWVESEPGVGSKFYFTLLAKKKAADALEGIHPVAAKDLMGRRALIIDDNPKNLELLGAACREMGMEAFLASSGLQALGWLSRRIDEKDPLPDLILMDILMPYMDGWKLIKEIRQIEACRAIKLIAISSDIRVGTAASLQDAGFGGFLPKPVLKKELLAVLMTVLGDQRRGGEIVTRHMAGELACKGVHVLLVDDSLANQTLMRAYFDLLGCVVDYASNGQQAVEMVRNNSGKYEVCFMDLHMPQMDGYAATQTIRMEITKDLPIIALTAATTLEDYRKCIDSGMNDHLSKPIQLGALRERIIKFSKKIPRKHS